MPIKAIALWHHADNPRDIPSIEELKATFKKLGISRAVIQDVKYHELTIQKDVKAELVTALKKIGCEVEVTPLIPMCKSCTDACKAREMSLVKKIVSEDSNVFVLSDFLSSGIRPNYFGRVPKSIIPEYLDKRGFELLRFKDLK